MKPQAYKTTSVPVEKSQGEVRRLLMLYGCTHVQTSEDLSQGVILVRFVHPIPDSDQRCVVRLQGEIPKVDPPKSKGRYYQGRWISSERRLAEARQAAERQAWRALYYIVKARMEAIIFGFETFEQAFLAHVEIVSTEGQKMTLGEWALPRMAQGRLALKAKED